MKIVAVSAVKNEADMTELWIRHHAPLFDRLFIVDDSNADDTAEIIRRCQDEGLPLVRWESGHDTFAYRQSDTMNSAIQRVRAELDPDAYFPLDADELVQARTREEIEAGLATIAPGQCGVHIWQTYVPVCEYGASTNPLRDCFRRRDPEGAALPKVILTRELVAYGRTSVGAHGVETRQAHEADRFAPAMTMPWKLAHLPVRSPDQWMARTITSGSKVWGPSQTDPQGGYFRDPWLPAWRHAPTVAEIRGMAMVKNVYPDHFPPPAGVAENERCTAEIEQRWPDLARIDLFRVLWAHIRDLRQAIARLGCAFPTAPEFGERPGSVVAAENYIEELSQIRFRLQQVRGA